MKTLDEALQTVVKVQAHTSAEESEQFIEREGPSLVEQDQRYNELRIELNKHAVVQEFLYCLYRHFDDDYALMLNVVFYFGARVGMEMEKNDSWKEKL